MKSLNSMIVWVTMLCGITFNMEADAHSWGTISYTVYSNFNVTFNQQDFKLGNFVKGDGLKIPIGVTHIDLILPGNIKRVEIPNSVRFICKDMFKAGGLQHLIIDAKTAALICKKPEDGDVEVYVRRYFSLPDNCQISLRQIALLKEDTDVSNDIPTPPPLDIKNKNNKTDNVNQDFLDEINKYDRNKLRKVDEKDINKNRETDFINEVKNFKRENLRKVEEKDLTSNREKQDDPGILKEIKNFDPSDLKHVDVNKDREKQDDTPEVFKDIKNFDHNRLKHVEVSKERERHTNDLIEQLRDAMEERRKDLGYDVDDYENDEDDWND